MENYSMDNCVKFEETEESSPISIEDRSERKISYCTTQKATTTADVVDGNEETDECNFLNVLRPEYEPLSRLGKGTFGDVWQCRKKSTNEMVAIKIVDNSTEFEDQVQTEVEVLKLLSERSSEEFFVKFYEFFSENELAYFVFEKLDLSLHDYCKRIGSALPLQVIRYIGRQLLTALQHLKLLGLVHGDLKPENIMFVDASAQQLKLKLIDFGSAISVKDEYCTCGEAYIQTRPYRAPEIILGLPFSEAADMWSLGCVIAGLFIGKKLFPGRFEYDQIGFIHETLGMPPPHMLSNSGRTDIFFCKRGFSSSPSWTLKNIFKSVRRKYSISCLEDILKLKIRNNLANKTHRKHFINLLKKTLTIDPEVRIAPEEALLHLFFTNTSCDTSQILLEPGCKRTKFVRE